MSGDELEAKVRDHDEAIRRIERDAERTNKEVIDGMRSLHKRLSMAQEYQLRDNRLTAEDIKESLKEAAALQAKGYANHEERLSALEDKTPDLAKAENNIWWLDRWVLALTGAFFSFLGYDIYKGMKP